MQSFIRTLVLFAEVMLILLFISAIVGCATDMPPPQTITVTKYQVIRPSDALLKDCYLVTPPPDPDVYQNATDEQRKNMLRDYASALQKVDFAQCAARWPELRKYFDAQAKLYAQPAP